MVQVILVMIGVGLLALAGALWLFRGRLMAILGAIDSGFKIVEDAIKINFLDTNAGLDRAKIIISETSTVLNSVQTSIRYGGNIIQTDIVVTMNSAGTALTDDVAPTLVTAGDIIHGGHGVLQAIGLDVDPLSIHWHPFGTQSDTASFVGKLHVVDTHVTGISNTSKNIGMGIKNAAVKLTEINGEITNIANSVQNISTSIAGLIPFIDTNLRGGFQNAVNLLGQTRANLSQILGVISPTMIALLSVSGVVFVIVGIMT